MGNVRPCQVTSHLRSIRAGGVCCGRRWYHILSRDEKARAAAEKRRAKAKKVISRPIRHPNFKNLSNLQAIAAMHDADVGACLFRPSEKGTDQITLTIKVRLGLRCRQAAMLC